MTECVSVKMHTDDKVDNQSNNSAASSDSGVITDEKFMPNSSQSNVGISTTITCENSEVSESAVNIENLLNLAKNVRPTKQKSAAHETTTKANSVTPPNKSSPALSIRSTNISITSLQSDVVSSVIDSDSDEFEDSNGNYTIKKLGQQTAFQSSNADFPHVRGSDGLVLLQQRIEADNMGPMTALSVPSSSSALATPSTPQLGNLAFTNSTDITIGQKNYYQGPVTIQQFLIENRKQEGASPPTGGTDNPAFQSPSPPSERRKPSHQDARPQLYKFLFDRRVVITTAVIIVIAIALGVAFIVANSTASRKSGASSTTTSGPPTQTTTESEDLGNGLVLVTRKGWVAEPAKGKPVKLELPSHRVVIAHTATPACDTKDSCGASVKSMQEYHQGPLHFDDIGFNFLVGGDGRVYEGRGWDIKGAHTKEQNSDTIGIAFIGNFMDELPPEKQLNAAKLIIAEGVKLNKLATDYRLYGARQLTSTESPGAFKPNEVRPQPYKFIFNRRAAIITAVIIALTIALGVVFATSSSVVKRKSSDNIGSGKYLRIVPRNDWLAEPPRKPLNKLDLPVHRIIISHTATESCVSQATCASLTKSIQTFHKYSRPFDDISYNFLIGGDGCVYEGRGWDDEGAHTKGYNKDSLGIAFIGTFTQEAPPEKQLNVAKLLIDEGIRLKKIVGDYKLYGARQLGPTESPGEALFAKIKNWPKWSNTV